MTSPSLSRFLQQKAGPPPGSVCDMCAEPIGKEHQHVVHMEGRRLMCTCRPCYLLFSAPGASGGRYRQVPTRYMYDPDFKLTVGQWDALQIPVGMAFFFFNSQIGETVALYPSPAGATESTLPLDAWESVASANPGLLQPEPDVEAVLVRKSKVPNNGTTSEFECFLVPIDVCYELVGRVRVRWKGFDGGQELWTDLDNFFDEVHGRAAKSVSR